jgi:hypothetical protein
MATSFRWLDPPSILVRALDDYRKRLLAAVASLADYFAARMQAYAQANARWTDRTGNARAGLRAVTVKAATAVAIVLFHTMDYGKWLELAHQGRYQILLPTLEAHYGQIVAALRRLVGAR